MISKWSFDRQFRLKLLAKNLLFSPVIGHFLIINYEIERYMYTFISISLPVNIKTIDITSVFILRDFEADIKFRDLIRQVIICVISKSISQPAQSYLFL